MAETKQLDQYDGLSAAMLAARAGVPRIDVFEVVGSTMDEAHAAAVAGAPAGTVVLADSQVAGRGRGGKSWSSPSRGVWLTLIERPVDPSALDVLSLRIGLATARILDAFASEPVRIKWPNDLYVDDAKLAGVLVEARWRGERLDWVAIGLGVNMDQPLDQSHVAVLESGTSRLDVICRLLPELRVAAAMVGALTSEEMDEYSSRDLARGHTCVEPLRGRVGGIAATGELLIELGDSIALVRTGSLTLEISE